MSGRAGQAPADFGAIGALVPLARMALVLLEEHSECIGSQGDVEAGAAACQAHQEDVSSRGRICSSYSASAPSVKPACHHAATSSCIEVSSPSGGATAPSQPNEGNG